MKDFEIIRINSHDEFLETMYMYFPTKCNWLSLMSTKPNYDIHTSEYGFLILLLSKTDPENKSFLITVDAPRTEIDYQKYSIGLNWIGEHTYIYNTNNIRIDSTAALAELIDEDLFLAIVKEIRDVESLLTETYKDMRLKVYEYLTDNKEVFQSALDHTITLALCNRSVVMMSIPKLICENIANSNSFSFEFDTPSTREEAKKHLLKMLSTDCTIYNKVLYNTENKLICNYNDFIISTIREGLAPVIIVLSKVQGNMNTYNSYGSMEEIAFKKIDSDNVYMMPLVDERLINNKDIFLIYKVNDNSVCPIHKDSIYNLMSLEQKCNTEFTHTIDRFVRNGDHLGALHAIADNIEDIKDAFIVLRK